MPQMVLFFNRILDSIGWPKWALEAIAALVSLVFLTLLVDFFIYFVISDKSNPRLVDRLKIEKKRTGNPKGFRLFQVQYLVVYLIIMLADWLQGTNMYTLYSVLSKSLKSLKLISLLLIQTFESLLP